MTTVLRLLLCLAAFVPAAQPAPAGVAFEEIAAETDAEREAWQARLETMVKAGELRVRSDRPNALVEGRRSQRLVQLYKGVPVEGAEVWRELEGRTLAGVDGRLVTGLDLDPVPKLTTDEAAAAFAKLAGGGPGPSLRPELVVLPMADGTARLAYRARVFANGEVVRHYLDARTGESISSVSEMGPPPR